MCCTCATACGRRTFELADGWAGDHHDGVPIFVLSRHEPDAAMRWPAVTYVSDVKSAVHMARDAAGEKDVLVHGAVTAQLALAAGVLDELQIHLIPVLLGQGRRLFEHLPAGHIELELLRALDGPGVLHLRYRVRPAGLDRRNDPGPSRQVFTELMSTRAVIAGRRTYELAGRWQGDHHDGVPVFVLTHDVPDDPPPGSVRYATDVRECAAQARAAAGDGEVMVHGAGAAQALLRAGQLDELELHVVPVLLGQGRRLFDNLPAEHIDLDLIRRLTTPQAGELAQHVTHLRYRVRGRN